MAKKNPMVIKFNHDHQNYLISDPTRIPLCVVDSNKSRGMQRMREEQRTHDANAAVYHGDCDGDGALA